MSGFRWSIGFKDVILQVLLIKPFIVETEKDLVFRGMGLDHVKFTKPTISRGLRGRVSQRRFNFCKPSRDAIYNVDSKFKDLSGNPAALYSSLLNFFISLEETGVPISTSKGVYTIHRS